METKPLVITLDLEGVLVPEIWIAVAKKTGVDALKLTTRDISDYDKLMHYRMKILKKEGIRLKDIQAVIRTIKPLPGAAAFLKDIRKTTPVVILSDTFYEFAMPLMAQLEFPALFCNQLFADKKGFISGYKLRQKDGKRKAVLRLQNMGFRVHAAGDSFNDTTMLKSADKGVFFNPPDKIAKQFPLFKKTTSYPALRKALLP